MELIIHKGAEEIGGNCIEIKTSKTTLLVDVGTPVSSERKAVDTSTLKPNAILLSHAHYDHYGKLHELDNTTIYMGQITKSLLQISHDFIPDREMPNNIEIFTGFKEFFIGDIKITPYPMDHSIIDAYGFLIEADGVKLFYTGDFRAHGRKSKLFQNLLKKSHKLEIDYLITEGTTIGDKQREQKLADEIVLEDALIKSISKTKENLTFIDFSSQNYDRLISAYKACNKCKKIFVVDIYTAIIIEKIKKILKETTKSSSSLTIDIGNIKVLGEGSSQSRKAKKSGIYKEELQKIYKGNQISIDEIIKKPSSYVLKASPYLAIELINKTKGGITYIYSQWQGYLQEQHNPKGYENYQKIATHPSVCFEKIHISGHIKEDDLIKLIDAMKPKYIIPIHTETKEYFKKYKNVLMLSNAESIQLPTNTKES